MTHFLRFGDSYRLASNNAIDIKDKLPAGTYAVKIDKEGYYLDTIANFELPKKLYGDCTKNANRIIQTFWDRPTSTGVFLEGEKGSGKTLLSKKIAIELGNVGVPTIVVNEAHYGESFNTFIQSINQPKVVFFDEFEKIYSNQADDFNGGVNPQERVLTLFDGVYSSKTLFMVTCNDSWRIDKNMKNRPGRMYYMLSFKGLDDSFIKEYAEENLKNKANMTGLLSISTLFGSFNFDMLKAVVEEMNRYNETAQEVIKLLNTKPSSDSGEFIMQFFVNSKEVELRAGYDQFNGNPLSSDITVNTWSSDMKHHKPYHFSPVDLQKVDGVAGTFLFINDKNQQLILRRKKFEIVDWSKFVVD